MLLIPPRPQSNANSDSSKTKQCTIEPDQNNTPCISKVVGETFWVHLVNGAIQDCVSTHPLAAENAKARSNFKESRESR